MIMTIITHQWLFSVCRVGWLYKPDSYLSCSNERGILWCKISHSYTHEWSITCMCKIIYSIRDKCDLINEIFWLDFGVESAPD